MGKSQLELYIEKATNENNVAEDWALIMDIIDQINQNNSEKEALRILTKRLNDRDPHIAIHTLSLLNACVKNCNKNFKLEVCSRVFIEAAKQFIMNTYHQKLSEKFASMIKSWCGEPEFQNDPALNLMQSLYIDLVRNGIDFGVDETAKTMKSSSTAKSVAQKEEEELAKAIALSLKESTSSQSLNKQQYKSNSASTSSSSSVKQESTNVSSLYGQINLNKRESERKKVKALYDFEAVEDNEITFKAGDILFVTDSSDENWWKGIDENRKEGLFPSNFVTADLEFEEEDYESNNSSKKVSFNDKVDEEPIEKNKQIHSNNVQILIDEKKIDDCIDLLQNADPTGEIQPDSQEMLQLEEQCYMMGPLIDQQLQKIDYKHAVLDDLNIKILEAFQMYNTLMKESITKTTGNYSNSFNPNIGGEQQQQNQQGGFIPFVAAPPQTPDANPYNLANQLNNFANYNMGGNMPMPTEQGQQNAAQAQGPSVNNNFQNNYASQPIMYGQQYGQQGQIPEASAQNNMAMPNTMPQGIQQQHYSNLSNNQ